MTRVVPAILALGAALGGCGGEATPETHPRVDPAVRTTMVDTATIAVPLVLAGQLYVEHDAVLYARAQGIVESVFVDLGTAVGAGDTLARLESADQAIALEEARAALAQAERALQRARALAGTGLIAAADSERVELEYRQATLAVRRSEREHEFTRVIAPFGGVVTQRQTRPGRLVQPGEPLFRVAARAPLLVSVRVPERAAATIRVGDDGTVTGLDGTVRTARVIRAAPTIDPASGTREVVLQVARGSGLAPGASVTVSVASEPRAAIVIPADALTEDGQVLVWEDGRAVLRAVTTEGPLPDGRVAVIRGLTAGERVVRR